MFGTLGLRTRLQYLGRRIRKFDLRSFLDRSRAVAKHFGKNPVVIACDMLWSSLWADTAFQDYVDCDFAILTRAERKTFMTAPLSNDIAMKHNAPESRSTFHDKLEFDAAFDAYLHREWIDVRTSTNEQLREFFVRHGKVIAKVPVSNWGRGVERYLASEIADWAGLRDMLVSKGQLLVEENIVQHPVLAEVCAGTANTTRVTTFFDGTEAHILSIAQKFGRGQASDQMSFGGFFTLLDATGKSTGPGHDSDGQVYSRHPDSGVSIEEFQLPMMPELRSFVDEICRVVPEMRYVGWDVVIGPDGPVLVEGNWAVGIYEHKPSVSGIRTGTRPIFAAAIGF